MRTSVLWHISHFHIITFQSCYVFQCSNISNICVYTSSDILLIQYDMFGGLLYRQTKKKHHGVFVCICKCKRWALSMRNSYLLCIVTAFISTPVAEPVGGGGGGGGEAFAPPPKKKKNCQLGSETLYACVFCFVLCWFGFGFGYCSRIRVRALMIF